jgi:hypothetical protein
MHNICFTDNIYLECAPVVKLIHIYSAHLKSLGHVQWDDVSLPLEVPHKIFA